MTKQEAREIIESFPPEFNANALPSYYYEAKGFLAGLAVKEEKYAKLIEAARGLSYGEDWNNGTHAKLHGYREKLLDALKAFEDKK